MSHGMMMEVSSPPEYASTTFSFDIGIPLVELIVIVAIASLQPHELSRFLWRNAPCISAKKIEQDGLLHVQSVLRLVEDDGAWAIDHFGGHFVSAMSGQAVHESSVWRCVC